MLYPIKYGMVTMGVVTGTRITNPTRRTTLTDE
jgi:hypothetical protein